MKEWPVLSAQERKSHLTQDQIILQLVVDVLLRLTGVNTFVYCGDIQGIVYVLASFHHDGQTNWRQVLAEDDTIPGGGITTILLVSTDEFLASSFASLCHDEWVVQLDDFFSYRHPRHNTRGAIEWIWNYIHFLSSPLGIPASHRGRHGCGPIFAIGADRRRKLDAHIFGKLDDPFNRDVWALVAMTFTNFPSLSFVFLILTFKLGRHIAPRFIFICFFLPFLKFRDIFGSPFCVEIVRFIDASRTVNSTDSTDTSLMRCSSKVIFPYRWRGFFRAPIADSIRKGGHCWGVFSIDIMTGK